MGRFISPNLKTLTTALKNRTPGAMLEGSSRSGKTISSIDFIILLCTRYETNAVINCVRQTYNSHKTTLYDDFNKRLHDFGLPSPFDTSKEVQSFKIFGNKINFLGADTPEKFQGAGADYWYFNEILDIQRIIFDNAEQRCRKMWWGDYNPRFSQHWVYDAILKRPDVAYLHTTWKDNPFISPIEKAKILSYDPNNQVNVTNGTADDYMWNVYGLGLRCAQTGLIFKDITWIDDFPTGIEEITYGMDFGYTNSPTAIVKVGRNGRRLYAQLLFYKPTESADEIAEFIRAAIPADAIVWADSADPGMINDLRLKDLDVFPVRKFEGSVRYGIDLIKQYKIHLVKHPDMIREAENYAWKTVQGIQVNEPQKGFDHAWDAIRYAVLSSFMVSDM